MNKWIIIIDYRDMSGHKWANNDRHVPSQLFAKYQLSHPQAAGDANWPHMLLLVPNCIRSIYRSFIAPG